MRRLVQTLGIDISQHQLHPLGGEGSRQAEPNPARRAGDESGSVVKVPHAPSSLDLSGQVAIALDRAPETFAAKGNPLDFSVMLAPDSMDGPTRVRIFRLPSRQMLRVLNAVLPKVEQRIDQPRLFRYVLPP
jgi:hypothetical protein